MYGGDELEQQVIITGNGYELMTGFAYEQYLI